MCLTTDIDICDTHLNFSEYLCLNEAKSVACNKSVKNIF